MFVETVKEQAKVRGNRYVVGLGDMPALIGVVERTFEVFQCESCGRQSRILKHNGLEQLYDEIDEPFYCKCQHLVGVQKKEKSPTNK